MRIVALVRHPQRPGAWTWSVRRSRRHHQLPAGFDARPGSRWAAEIGIGPVERVVLRLVVEDTLEARLGDEEVNGPRDEPLEREAGGGHRIARDLEGVRLGIAVGV